MAYGNYPDLSLVKRVLVVKMRHHGDVLLTSPVFTNLKRAMPQAEIDAFIYKDTLPMLEGHPSISQFLLYDRNWKKLFPLKKILKELSLLKKIRNAQYDLVINLTEGDRGAIAAWASKSRYRVGFDPGKKGLLGKRNIYTHIVKNCPHPRHTVEKQLDVLRRIGIFPTGDEKDVSLHIPASSSQRVQEMLSQEGLSIGGYIVIHPVSRWRFKCLSTEQIARLVTALHQRGEKIVLTASPDPDELQMIDDICSKIPEIPILNFAGKTGLKELSALIGFAKALITVDSVPLHIASATKTPVVALFGPTSDQNWGPWMNPRAQVVAQRFSCRPCYQDGCGGSKMSDCLFTMPQSMILDAFDRITENLGTGSAAFKLIQTN
ncbi:MAG: putative lipopolysaccharide heptosyltransferase III [Verrucomicrobia bacterium]|nr:putative lipopolysaccharide heptosyltransferase III [Verrucomicrobiota bacterium]